MVDIQHPINYYNEELRRQFNERVQKISIHAGFTCPNRDGSKGVGGCTYCNNQSFHPEYCAPIKTPLQQMEEGIGFFHHKYKAQKYLAYFQAYTNTYGSIDKLKSMYESVLVHPKVVGLVVGTRPDCVSEELLDYFAELSKRYYVMIEYGVESTSDKTLEFINRGHTYQEAVEAIHATAGRGIFVGAHLIIGLPFESREEILGHADRLSQLPLTMLKLHQLQIVKGTKMALQYTQNPEWFNLYTVEEYIDLAICFLERLSPHIAIERFVSQSPHELLLAPDWGVKNYQFTDKLNALIASRSTWQGRYCRLNE